jgi:hypothetical protein
MTQTPDDRPAIRISTAVFHRDAGLHKNLLAFALVMRIESLS